MMKYFFIGVLLLHGLIHLMGFVKAFDLAPIQGLTQDITRTVGLLWLLAALLLGATAVAFAVNAKWWWLLALTAAALSQFLIFTVWQDAKFGALANLFIVLVALLNLTDANFARTYQQDVQTNLERTRSLSAEILTEADLAPLPPPVQQYLRYVGAVGQPKVVSMRAVLSGEMRSPGKSYFPLTAEQYNFYDEPTRLFFMQGRMFGVTVPGYHRYQGDQATMDVRPFGLLPIVKQAGDVMFTADTVTLFNDMCLLAPATLIDRRITWETIDEMTVQATFTNQGVTISAILYFNEAGQLINFVSEDRWDITTMRQYPFSTPVSQYRNLNGFNLPTYGELIWHYPEGDFIYGKLEVNDVFYN